ncbi:GNAT family N-acetyltransferase [Streptomyces sp. NPDC020607]|uniref:GNAT family N-acetyltransferase n=1 Tax=Streptomyces sp. NPDC020607 TaxID=3365082 RepID=UPI0037BC0BDF
MITATPRPAPLRELPAHELTAGAPARVPVVRPAREEDAAALAALSQPFVRSGALRERPTSLYSEHAADFLVMAVPGGPLEGCVGLRVHAADPVEGRGAAGVLYNFCVAGHRQGRGVGAGLMRAVLAVARAKSLSALFTATTGGGDLFLRYGFAPAAVRTAPPTWAGSLDPRRNARILARSL